MTDKPVLRSQIRNGLEVIKLDACGYTNPEIAQKLFIAPETIRSRMRAFYKAVRARDRHHALAIALVHGWLTVDDLQTAIYNLRPEKDDEERIQPRR